MAKVLVVGSGGREHAIAYRFHKEGHEVHMSGINPAVEEFGVCVALTETYAQLQTLFDAAVEKDLQGNDFKNTVDLKWKVYKQLLQKSDGFAGDLFTKA